MVRRMGLTGECCASTQYSNYSAVQLNRNSLLVYLEIGYHTNS